jgi:hemolysin III
MLGADRPSMSRFQFPAALAARRRRLRDALSRSFDRRSLRIGCFGRREMRRSGMVESDRRVKEFNGIRWAYDRYEIIVDGIVNGIGVVFALIGATVLIFYATLWSSYGGIAAAWIYGVGLVLTLAMSFSYNLWPVSRTKWILRRFDHSAIFVLIAATYTPFLQRGADDPLLFAMLIAIWVIAAIGVGLKCLLPGRYDRLAILLYLAMGWSGLLVAEPVAERIPFASMLLIVIGGVIYSLGVIFHVWERLRFQNAIWHGFVVAAAAVHYSAVLTCFSLSPGNL